MEGSANQIAAFNVGNACSNLLEIAQGRKYSNRGGSSALPISTLISFIYSFVILFLERLEQISAKVGHSWGGG